jgi:hypothetical protein
MEEVFSADASGMAKFAATHHAAAETISNAGSADHEANIDAAATALGPIGAHYLAEYAPAQAYTLAATTHAAHHHEKIACKTEVSSAAFFPQTGQPHPTLLNYCATRRIR